jgi:hypothetical protein
VRENESHALEKNIREAKKDRERAKRKRDG